MAKRVKNAVEAIEEDQNLNEGQADLDGANQDGINPEGANPEGADPDADAGTGSIGADPEGAGSNEEGNADAGTGSNGTDPEVRDEDVPYTEAGYKVACLYELLTGHMPKVDVDSSKVVRDAWVTKKPGKHYPGYETALNSLFEEYCVNSSASLEA